MYSQKMIAKRASRVESHFPIKLVEHSVGQVDEWLERLEKLVSLDSTASSLKLSRPHSEEEKAFISNELFMCKINYPYWASRYAWIRNDKGGEVRFNFWESQEILLKTVGELEDKFLPILIINLKARQIGSSTFTESILTHKVLFSSGITSMLAADEPGQSEFLFNMMERIYDHLPYWMKPHRKYQVKGTQMFFDELDSNVLVDSGNKRVGGLGQGKAIHCGHLSELATWENPEQVPADLMPAILSALSPRTFFVFESTAKGKVSMWRDWWLSAKRGKFYGFVPVFIPWYAIKEKYASDPPAGWEPSERSKNLAISIKMTKRVSLSLKQLFWWERTYESYKDQNRLNDFFAEYASDDEEAFQLTGRSVFPTEVIQDLRRKAMTKPLLPYEIQQRGLVNAF